MWTYEKKLQYPVNIKTPNPRLAKFIISQLGGPDGELAASLRYMHQRYGMKNNQVKGILTDIATEELAHVEMVSAILYQLTRDMTPEQILQDGYAEYFVDHTAGIYPQGASGMPFTAAYFQSKGDPITDLTEDLAAEQKARSTYENILRLCDDPDVREPIKFLRQREIVPGQRDPLQEAGGGAEPHEDPSRQVRRHRRHGVFGQGGEHRPEPHRPDAPVQPGHLHRGL